jgi:hypothetical protein
MIKAERLMTKITKSTIALLASQQTTPRLPQESFRQDATLPTINPGKYHLFSGLTEAF